MPGFQGGLGGGKKGTKEKRWGAGGIGGRLEAEPSFSFSGPLGEKEGTVN